VSILIPLAVTASAFSVLGWWLHRAYAAFRARPGGCGASVPPHVIVTAVSLGLGGAAGVVALLVPAAWPPIGAGIAVTSLALAFYALWHGRQRP
jgi:hypothetical protein